MYTSQIHSDSASYQETRIDNSKMGWESLTISVYTECNRSEPPTGWK